MDLGKKQKIDFGRPLADETIFRSRSSATWTEQTSGISLKQSFFILQFIGNKNVVGIYWQIDGHTKSGVIVEAHTLALEFRTKLWLDWLFWEISPQALYLRENDFEFEPGLLTSIEMIL